MQTAPVPRKTGKADFSQTSVLNFSRCGYNSESSRARAPLLEFDLRLLSELSICCWLSELPSITTTLFPMWWEVVTELAYKMALDCGQAHDFFDMVDALSKHNASQQKMTSQTAMSTLLGHDWRNRRKRGRDPIRRISQFNGLIDDKNEDNGEHPESVLVKRSESAPKQPSHDMMSLLKTVPVEIGDRISSSPKVSSFSPNEKVEKVEKAKAPLSKPLIKQTMLVSQPNPVASITLKKSSPNVQQSSVVDKGLGGNVPPSRGKSPEKKQQTVRPDDSSPSDRKHLRAVYSEERKPAKPSFKPGLAEKKQKPKKRRSSSTKSTSKEYVVNSLKSVKVNEDGELVYLVEWQGDWDDTWEPYHFVAHLEDDIEQVYQNASREIQAAMRMHGHVECVD